MSDLSDERGHPLVHSSHFDTDSWGVADWRGHAMLAEREVLALRERVAGVERERDEARRDLEAAWHREGTTPIRLMEVTRQRDEAVAVARGAVALVGEMERAKDGVAGPDYYGFRARLAAITGEG